MQSHSLIDRDLSDFRLIYGFDSSKISKLQFLIVKSSHISKRRRISWPCNPTKSIPPKNSFLKLYLMRVWSVSLSLGCSLLWFDNGFKPVSSSFKSHSSFSANSRPFFASIQRTLNFWNFKGKASKINEIHWAINCKLNNKHNNLYAVFNSYIKLELHYLHLNNNYF